MPQIIPHSLSIPIGDVELAADLQVPEKAQGLVIFSHGSGSSRLSPRNRYVAGVLNEHGLATLLADLLTPEEDRIYTNRFDIKLLTHRLAGLTEWVSARPELAGLRIGYFGASTGAASALRAAARLPERIAAVVSRGGRPDLAMDELPAVQAPTLLIVGSLDTPVIGLNRQAYAALNSTRELRIVAGATHLFEEPGRLEEAARLATGWFEKYLLRGASNAAAGG